MQRARTTVKNIKKILKTISRPIYFHSLVNESVYITHKGSTTIMSAKHETKYTSD